MTTTALRPALLCLLPAMALFNFNITGPGVHQDPPAPEVQAPKAEKAIRLYYLEIVTPDMEAMCSSLERMHGVKFSDPVAEFGNARTTALADGGLLGVRAPMRKDEEPTVRPYILVDDIESAVESAKAGGGKIAMPPMEIPKRGRFAIYIQGGIQHGLWQK